MCFVSVQVRSTSNWIVPPSSNSRLIPALRLRLFSFWMAKSNDPRVVRLGATRSYRRPTLPVGNQSRREEKKTIGAALGLDRFGGDFSALCGQADEIGIRCRMLFPFPNLYRGFHDEFVSFVTSFHKGIEKFRHRRAGGAQLG